MASEDQKLTIIQLVCVGFGIALFLTIAMAGFGFMGMIPGGIAGGLGAAFGALVFELIRKGRKRAS